MLDYKATCNIRRKGNLGKSILVAKVAKLGALYKVVDELAAAMLGSATHPSHWLCQQQTTSTVCPNAWWESLIHTLQYNDDTELTYFTCHGFVSHLLYTRHLPL